MDSIRIIITRNCDAQGNGGEVIDNAAAVLGSIGNTPVLNAIVEAFADAYGIHQIDDGEGNLTPITPVRNVSFRIRQYATEIVTAYMQKVAAEQARTQAGQQAGAALAAVIIVEAG